MKIRRTRPTVVYAMTNAADKNEVIAYLRRRGCKLVRAAAFATGGRGLGTREISGATPQDGIDPLASQNSLVLSRDGRYLFAVNAGSDSVSVFRVAFSGALRLVDVEPSGGAQPNTLAAFGNILYVANVGNVANSFNSNITGFIIAEDGRLIPLPGATYSLSTRDAQPASIVFSPDGSQLAVTELTTNRITVFSVNSDGTLSNPTINPSAGPGPFGSTFLSSGALLVSEAGANALSSYALSEAGVLRAISASVPTGQMASCWVVTSRGENFAYVSNTGSGTVTVYRITDQARLQFLRNIPISRQPMNASPTDSGVSRDGRCFYVLNGSQGSVSVFSIQRNGLLRLVQIVGGLPTLGAQGLAVR